jgi:hypothetical protein
MNFKSCAGLSTWGLLVVFSLLYGAGMLALGVANHGYLYQDFPYHTLQAEAMLQGHFWLADSVADLKIGLAWHEGKVQQVWGLGVGIWLLPFVGIWKLVGVGGFPDRIPLGFAFSMLAFYTGSTGINLIRQGQKAFGLGLIWLITLCPAMWTLTRASGSIFEQTVLYATILSLGILVSLIRVTLFGSKWDYLLCCILSSLAAWIRPTHGIYGLCALGIATLIVYRKGFGLKLVCMALGIGVCSLGLLAWTNTVRFGAPTEFGHKHTFSTETMMFLTRFGNPYSEVSSVEAAKELGSMLLLNPRVQGRGAFSSDLFPGQSSTPRWRRLTMTAFDISYAALSIAGILCALAILIPKSNQQPTFVRPEAVSFLYAMLIWGCLSVFGLSIFYLRYAAIASRYLLDFAPALTAFILLGWCLISFYRPSISLLGLGGWLVFQLATARVPSIEPQKSFNLSATTLSSTESTQLMNGFGGNYTKVHHPHYTGITCNGFGWEPESGFARPIVVLTVDNPGYLQLRVDSRRMFYGEPAKEDAYQAMIDGMALPLRSVEEIDDEVVVTFDLPDAILRRNGLEVVFLCFVQDYGVEDRVSERILHSIQWR